MNSGNAQCKHWVYCLGVGLMVLMIFSVALAQPSDRANIPMIKTDIASPELITIEKDGRSIVVRAPSHAKSVDYAYSHDANQSVTEVADQVSVEYTDAASIKGNKRAEILAVAKADTAMTVYGDRHVMHVKDRAKDAIAALNARPEVRYAYPVMYDMQSLSRIVVTDRIVVCLASLDVSIDDIAERYGAETVEPLKYTNNQWVIRVNTPKTVFAPNVASIMSEDTDIAWAQPDCIREFLPQSLTPNDSFFSNQWHLHSTGQNIGGKTPLNDNDVDAPEAWDITTGSTDVIIAIVDTGVQTAHPDLAVNIDPRGYDFYDDDDDPNPAHSIDNHGTPCAGVAAAAGNNSLGVAGMAYNCKILPIKIAKAVWNEEKEQYEVVFAIDSKISESIRYAAQYADVISCSWGKSGGYPDTVLKSALDDARQDGKGGKGSICLFASGNDDRWFSYCVPIPTAGTYTFRWKYTKNASIANGEDTCWLDWVEFPGGNVEHFDSVTPPVLPSGWTTSGVGPWTSVQADSVHPAKTGSQFVKAGSTGNNQTSYIQVTKTVISGDLWYDMRVNCENPVAVGDDLEWRDYAEFELVGHATYYQQARTVKYPAYFDCTVAVGASNSNGTKSHYSQYGEPLDFVAPSSGNATQLLIETVDRTGNDGYNTSSGTAGDYCKAGDSTGFSGTSSATPLAAGIAALIRSVNPDLSPTQIRNILRETANKIDTIAYTGRQTGRNLYYGYGRVNAYGAVQQAQTQRSILEMADDIKITEVTNVPSGLAYVEIYNSSTTTSYSLNNLALTNNEAGGDTGEGSCRFPEGYSIPPRGMVVVVLGSLATSSFINEVTANASGPEGPSGGVQVFESVNSGLSFQSSAIPDMELLSTRPALAASDNVMLVLTDGYAITFLSEVVDGVVYGTPTTTGESVFGVAPKTAETDTFASTAGLADGYALHRVGEVDSNDSYMDFQVNPRTPGALNGPTNCDDGDACTIDSYDEIAGECVYEPKDCDDGNVCNGLETCDPETGCVSGEPLDCGDGVACTVDTCDPSTGCAHTPDDAACDDGNVCNGLETCDPEMGCVSGEALDCGDGVECTVDTCDPVTGCAHTPDDAACDDGNVCNGLETCDPLLGCQPGTSLDCNDDNACTADSCDPAAGCIHIAVDCNDGMACTVDTCDPVTGCAHTPDDTACDDGLDCTVDLCNPVRGCVHMPDNKVCGDSNVCNGIESCDPVMGCVSGKPLDCSDGVDCTIDSCHPFWGCKHTPDNAACDDGNTCTLDSCDPSAGCIHEWICGEGEGEVLPEGEGETPVEGEGEVLPEGEGEILPEGEGEVPAEGEGEVQPEGEGEEPVEGEGEIPIEGEGELACTAPSPYGPGDPCYVAVVKGDSYCCYNEWDRVCQSKYDNCVTFEGEGEVLPEGEVPAEGEGEVPIEGEGEVPAEGEGEILPEGEGEILPEGEGEVLPEGEGEVLPEGEGEIVPEGEGEVLPEGEDEGEDQSCGCCKATDKNLSPRGLFERGLGDWLLIGLCLLALTALTGARK